jgi:hypothetical protein
MDPSGMTETRCVEPASWNGRQTKVPVAKDTDGSPAKTNWRGKLEKN